MRVLLAEDHALLRVGLKIILEQQGVDVVGEAGNGEEAVSLALAHAPEVVLMDLGMPLMDGIEASRRIRDGNENIKIIMLTSHSEEEHIHASLAAGVNGYCLKETKPDRLLTALAAVQQGDLWLDSNIAATVMRSVVARPNADSQEQNSRHQLTLDELRVLHLIIEGLQPADIAARLELTPQQVKELEFSIMQKLATSDRTQDALRALRSGTDPSSVSVAKQCSACGREFKQNFQRCPIDDTSLDEVSKDSLTGRTFADRYEVLSRLGNGGMSIIYKARHKFLKRTVALKVLDPLLTSDLANARRFREEAYASSLLNHPNLIQTIDFGLSSSGEPYIVMDYIDGCSLDQILAKELVLSVPQALKIFLQACDGLAHAHNKGVIHRDMKPSNMMLIKNENDEYHLKIIDFGIAKILGERSQALTQRGEIVGSPCYMSPEQCQGTSLDERSDIYSLGCALYVAVTGELPFLGKVAAETMRMHIDAPAIPPSLRAPELPIPAVLDAVILKMLEKNPADRYQSAAELRRDLDAVLDVYSDPVWCA